MTRLRFPPPRLRRSTRGGRADITGARHVGAGCPDHRTSLPPQQRPGHRQPGRAGGTLHSELITLNSRSVPSTEPRYDGPRRRPAHPTAPSSRPSLRGRTVPPDHAAVCPVVKSPASGEIPWQNHHHPTPVLTGQPTKPARPRSWPRTPAARPRPGGNALAPLRPLATSSCPKARHFGAALWRPRIDAAISSRD